MAIRSLSDVNAAYESGRFHSQRYFKNAATNNSSWTDQSFSSGQPGYDARVGTANTFTPVIATGNDAVWFPQIAAGQDRHLESFELRFTRGASSGLSAILFDLVGYYPLIDGDSTDTMILDNTATLPRYQDGVGVIPVFISYIAPSVQNGRATMTYIGTDDVERSVTFNVFNSASTGGVVVSGANISGTSGSECNINIPTLGSAGVKQITSITYITPPSGLHCIYLIKPLASVAGMQSYLAVNKSLFPAMPKIPDGAALNLFTRQAGGTSAGSTVFGNFNFIWG